MDKIVRRVHVKDAEQHSVAWVTAGTKPSIPMSKNTIPKRIAAVLIII